MKKTFTLIAVLLFTVTAAQAQRINSFTIEGIPALCPSSAFNPTNNNEAKPGDLQIVYPQTADLSNVVGIYNCGTDAAMITSPAPTNFTTVQNVKVEKTDKSSWALYNITCKKINPTTLPFTLPVGAGFSDSWKPETIGWAGVRLDKGKDEARFGGADASLVLAFNDTPDKINFSINAGAAEGLAEGSIFDVEESADGVTWTSIVQFTHLTMPHSDALPAEKEKEYSLKSESRYARFVFSNRQGKINATVSTVTITKSTGTAINSKLSDIAAKAFIANNSRELTIVNVEEVAKVELFNIAAQAVYTQVRPANTINLNALPNGIYMVCLTAADGSIATSKVALK